MRYTQNRNIVPTSFGDIPQTPLLPRAPEVLLLADAVAHSPALIVLADSHGRIRMVNQACEATTGWSREGLCGRAFLDALVASEARAFCAAVFPVDIARCHTPITMTLPLATRTGKNRRIQWTLSATEPDRGTTGDVVGIGIDVTEQAAEQDQARRRHADLVRLLYRAMFTHFAGALAHELSQPLSAVLAYIQGSLRLQAQGGAVSEEVAAYLEKAVVQASRAGDLARSMRRSRQSHDERPCELFDVESVVREVVMLLEADLLCRRVTVDLELSSALPSVGLGPMAMELVLFSLFQICFETIAADGGAVAHLRIAARRSGDAGVEIAVTLTGPGSAAALRRARPTVSADFDSVGLGLGTCRSILREHGGDLEVRETTSGLTLVAVLPEISQGTCR